MRASEVVGGISFMCPERSASLNPIQLTPSVAANCSSDPALDCLSIRATADRSRTDASAPNDL